MRTIQTLLAVVAMIMSLQVSASLSTYADTVSKMEAKHKSHAFISDLFGSLRGSEIVHDNSRARNYDNSRRAGKTVRFRTINKATRYFKKSARVEVRRLIRERRTGFIEEPISSAGAENNFASTNTPSAVPVPAAVWLFASGIAGLFAFSSRRKA